MNQQAARQVQESVTDLSVPDVIAAAIRFFARRGGVYAAFVEHRGPSHVVLRGQGGEELVIAARLVPEGTAVTGSTYLFDQQVAQFLASLPLAAPVVAAPPDDAVAAVSAPVAGASA